MVLDILPISAIISLGILTKRPDMTNFALDPNIHQEDASAKIVFALERLSHVFRIHWWEQNKKYQLSPLQMQILIALRFHGHLDSVSTMAAYLDLTNATISDAVRVLGQKKYVQKRPDSEDGRRHHIALTDSGTQAAEELSLFANQIGDFVATLPNQGLFLESLLQLMQLLQENAFIPLQQMCTTCRHLRRPEGSAAAYYCQLLDRPLGVRDLRIHCPEYETLG